MSEIDEFNVSDGNIIVLKDIMEMMTIPNYRRRLRKIVMEYHLNKDKENPFIYYPKRKWQNKIKKQKK